MIPTNFKRVCIYGASAIGGWIGEGLARAGCEVSVMARGATLAALQQHGLRVRHGDDERQVAVRACLNSHHSPQSRGYAFERRNRPFALHPHKALAK